MAWYDDLYDWFSGGSDSSFDISNPEFYYGNPELDEPSNLTGSDWEALRNAGFSTSDLDSWGLSDPTFLGQVGKLFRSVGSAGADVIKGAFTKDGQTDWRAIATAAGALIPVLTGGSGSSSRPSGYQGGIPQYTAVRRAVSDVPSEEAVSAAQSYFAQNPDVAQAYSENTYGMSPEQFAQEHYKKFGKAEGREFNQNLGLPALTTYDPNRRPGSGGRRYFSDVQYVPSGSDVSTAQNAAMEQVQGLAALNAANPLNAAPPAYQPPAPPPATTQPAPPAYDESYSGANVLNTVRSMLGTQNLARGGIVGLQDGGFVFPADVVSGLGNGSTDAGLEFLAHKGAVPIRGKGDGMSDSIRTTINGRQPAAVADGEAYLPPRQVQNMGGAEKLYAMMDKIRKDRTGTTKQGRQINPNQYV